ncbi:MAG TPA: hypothetical protein VL728_17105 [Cyclobacteriaceae bacterium]|jgi:hypothetical protein|nr:hypothetical protein [Cyclobacteriaceae bacterium]
MKTIKSALLGNKQLIDTNADVLLIQLKEIIKEHRALVITRLIGDLPTYLDYKFEMKVNKDVLVKIKEELLELKNGSVDLKAYDNVVQQLLNRAVVHLTNEPFYKEIDECLSIYVAEKEIKFS